MSQGQRSDYPAGSLAAGRGLLRRRRGRRTGPNPLQQEPDTTSRAVLDNIAKAHNDLQRLAKVFFIMEAISLPDCPAILKKPR